MLVLANGLEVYYTIFNYCLLSQQGYPVMIILVMGLESTVLYYLYTGASTYYLFSQQDFKLRLFW